MKARIINLKLLNSYNYCIHSKRINKDFKNMVHLTATTIFYAASVWPYMKKHDLFLNYFTKLSQMQKFSTKFLFYLALMEEKTRPNFTHCVTHPVRRLCWRRGTAFLLCAITASVAAYPIPSGTVARYPSHFDL